MPRISLWRGGARTADYKFMDQNIREMFTVGGVGINLHKYLGAAAKTGSNDATKPNYDTVSEGNIQDLLFLENRDRKYDTSVYNMRGVYQPSSVDFDLTQFGIFNANDTVFVVFHYNDMIDTLGRKIMSGDVLEFEHLKDYHPLDSDLPAALKRYYVVSDATYATEGFGQTWWAHLWRVKCGPLVDSQEYRDILKKITAADPGDPYAAPGAGSTALADLLSQYNKNITINEAIIQQSEREVPASGYDTTSIYVVPTNSDATQTASPDGINASLTDDPDASVADMDISRELVSPVSDLAGGYLTGDGIPPNGLPVKSGTAFPAQPSTGDYCLRLDYFPNRLFRYDGRRWVRFEDAVRTSLTPGAAQTQRGLFVNNEKTHRTNDGRDYQERQGLSQALRITPDN
jgi:hypothetical protein